MKKSALVIVFCFFMIFILQAQTADKYRRSSLYSILIKHAEKEFCPEIVEVFNSIPIPDKFDNHNLNVRIVNAYVPPHLQNNKELQKQNIETFLTQNDIGRRVIAKWFNRDKNSGSFDINLVAQRGYYNASILDMQIADMSIRGRNMLADAGIELIGNTFIIVNDIRYLDKVEEVYMDNVFGRICKAVASKNVADFEINITSYLYRLDWTDEIESTFYNLYWFDKASGSDNKKAEFDNDRKTFTIKYFGSQTVVSSGKTTKRGINTKADETSIKQELIKKVCTRAIDKTIVQLQQTYDEFKVKTPLISTIPIKAYIGRKEGVSEETKYEVLEKNEDENGHTFYKRIGIIQPIKGKIWDNRYLAVEEGFNGAELGATEFVKISGDDFYIGMLIKEMK
jgi:hypothetical protein